ncbi:MAG: hypothetical protein MR610_05730 [Olsenella sp.]|nr:hypothetical protein [Olsenella sp.]
MSIPGLHSWIRRGLGLFCILVLSLVILRMSTSQTGSLTEHYMTLSYLSRHDTKPISTEAVCTFFPLLAFLYLLQDFQLGRVCANINLLYRQANLACRAAASLWLLAIFVFAFSVLECLSSLIVGITFGGSAPQGAHLPAMVITRTFALLIAAQLENVFSLLVRPPFAFVAITALLLGIFVLAERMLAQTPTPAQSFVPLLQLIGFAHGTSTGLSLPTATGYVMQCALLHVIFSHVLRTKDHTGA